MIETLQHITLKKDTCGCRGNHLSVHVRMNRYDPTRTMGLQNAWIRQLNSRFAAILRAIYTKVVVEDGFGLKLPKIASYNEFAFGRSDEKVEAFMNWLKQQEAQGLLQTTTLNQYGTGIEKAWTNVYIEDSYKRGLQRAQTELSKTDLTMGVPNQNMAYTMNNPFHVDRVGALYSRTFNELKGITAAMDTQISRVLAQGLVDGDNPMLLARKMKAIIAGGGGDLGITDTLGRFIPAKRRAEMMARTEVIRAHHQGMIQEYENYGLLGVKVQAEWATSGFDVCEKCAGMEGQVYTLAEIRNMIPAHPNCRCIALPVEVEAGKK